MTLCKECQRLADRDDRSGSRVAVFGAGIAGMTAAHELVERSFAVDVFEAAADIGGLAATQYYTSERVFGANAARAAKKEPAHAKPPPDAARAATDAMAQIAEIARIALLAEKPGEKKAAAAKIAKLVTKQANAAKKAGSDDPLTLPGEHGFRAFYSFYRHVTDTMERIPLAERLADERRDSVKRRPGATSQSVADNLIPTYKVAVALEGNVFREVEYDRRQPRSAAAATYVLGLWMVSMGFTSSDIARVVTRMLQFLTSCRERRYCELAGMSLMTYLGKTDLSPQFQDRFKAISRFLVAIDPGQGDAMTQAMVMCRILMDPVVSGESQRNLDRVLNGPTTERWFDPWQFFLSEQKVGFIFGQKLERLKVRNGVVTDAFVTCVSANKRGRPQACDNKKGYWLRDKVPAYAYFVSAIPGNALWPVLTASPGLLAADVRETKATHDSYESNLSMTDTKILEPRIPKRLQGRRMQVPRDDWKARRQRQLWIDHSLAGSVTFTGDPPLVELENLLTSRGKKRTYGPWMSGIQFYLSDSLTVLPGHIHFPDSKWALTAVCQSQFWGGDFYWRYGDHQVRSIISVDICEFDKPGEFIKKPAIKCSEDEIAAEVWFQLKKGLQAWDLILPDPYPRDVKDPLGLRGQRPHNQQILNNLAVMAMKKNGGRRPPIPVPYLDHHLDARIKFNKKGIRARDTNIQYFVPEVDSWRSRPGPLPPLEAWDQGYRVRLGSLVIVGHFAQTFTSINTMEAANESARHGVNAIIKHYEDRYASDFVHMERCTVWPLEADEPAELDFLKQIDRSLFWDDAANAPKAEAGEEFPGHLFELLHVDKWVAAMLPSLGTVNNAEFSHTRLWDSDGWKRFEQGFGSLWEKVLTLGRFSTPFS